jgi:hypothetical protein
LPVRQSPTVHLDGDTLHTQFGSLKLTRQEAAVLEACDGRRGAIRIAEALAAKSASDFRSEDAVLTVLDRLLEKELILCTPPIPSGAAPEQSLRRTIELIDDPEVRARAMSPLAEIEALRGKIAGAAGDAESLGRAITELEAAFTRLTGSASSRAEGKTYVGRTLIYEDCRRDIIVDIGRDVLESLKAPLSLLLASARWFTYSAASGYKRLFEDLYAEMARDSRSQSVDAFAFWTRVQSMLYGSKTDVAAGLERALAERWSTILPIPEDERSVSFDSEKLRPSVAAAFSAPCPGWQYARYHSPDVMIAASSVEAMRRGDYQLILGEIHIAANTLSYASFVNHHPSPDELFTSTTIDLPEARAIPMPPKYWPGRTSRSQSVLVGPNDVCIEFAKDAPGLMESRSMPLSAFVITQEESGLILQSRDGNMKFPLLDTFSEALMSKVVDSLRIAPPARHTPRVSIDKLVVARESWRFAANEIEFAYEKDEGQRFLGARRWARDAELPRFAFYKSEVEIKPCFVDFESPILVNMFAKLIRRTADESDNLDKAITISEMLPAFDELWLPDSSGNLYTSELRIIAVDLSGGS